MHEHTDFAAFEQAHQARGFDECLVRTWEPGHDTGIHTHPFDIEVLVHAGEFWLTVGDTTRHLKAGDRFALGRNIEHAERYGEQGAVFWVARRMS